MSSPRRMVIVQEMCQSPGWIFSALADIILSSSSPHTEKKLNENAVLLIFPQSPRFNFPTTSFASTVVPSLFGMSSFNPYVHEYSSHYPVDSEDVPFNPYENSPDDYASLVPPRPPFMTSANRSSWSSTTFSSSSEHSEPDREHSPTASMSVPQPPSLSRPSSQRKLRRSISGEYYSSQDSHGDEVSQQIFMRRPPPSSFKHSFQSHPGNPDPLPPRNHGRGSPDSFSPDRPSSAQGFRDNDALPSPSAPLIGGAPDTPTTPASNTPRVYRDSVAGNLAQESQTNLPRTSSVPSFRSPFLSPASRPSSTIWSPPVQPVYGSSGTPDASTPQLVTVKKFRPPMPSTMLTEKLSNQEKSWLRAQKGDRTRLSWWLTALMWLVGLCVGALKVFLDYKSIHLLNDSQLCSVFVENFDSLNLNDWTPDIQLGGFGYVYLFLSATLPLA